MKTKLFTQTIERAIVEVYGPDCGSEFDTVPYLDDAGKECKFCLGIFLRDGAHMAAVAAQAMLQLFQSDDIDAQNKEEIMEDFAILMQIFRVAPYMQWTCMYWPGLTVDQEEIDLEDQQGDLT